MAIRKVQYTCKQTATDYRTVVEWCKDNWGPQDKENGISRWWYRRRHLINEAVSFYVDDDEIDLVEFKLRWL